MTYTPPTLTPAQMLADAQYKRHLLQTGRLSVEVEVEGRRTRYQRTDIAELEGYIETLEDIINNVKPRYGAIGFFL